MKERNERNFPEIPEDANPYERQSTHRSWILKDAADTIALGEELIEKTPNLKILLLKGPLGAGKTTLVKGIANNLGIKEAITSPTFALAQHYLSGIRPLIHIDLYRLEETQSADQLFLQEEEEASALNAIMAIEWSDRLDLVIEEAWNLEISYLANEGRKAQLIPPLDAARNSMTSE